MNAEILPQARQGSYFFNRIGQGQSFVLSHPSAFCIQRGSFSHWSLLIAKRKPRCDMEFIGSAPCLALVRKLCAAAVATKKRSASDYTLRCIGRHPKFRVIAVGGPHWVYHCFTRWLTFEANSKRIGTIPIGDPLPNIPGHIVEPVAGRLVTTYRFGANLEFITGSGHWNGCISFQVFAIFPHRVRSHSPRIIRLFKTTHLAAYSHSASVSRRLCAHFAYASASSCETCTTGWFSLPSMVLSGPSG